VILLLFEVGLESDLNEMRRVGVSALLVAVIGVVVPMLLGIGVAWVFLPRTSPLVWVFVGATLCATSVGITARVLRDLGQIQRPEARIVLGAAVIDDVLGLVVLAAVSGIISASSRGAELGGAGVALLLVKALGFLVGAIFLGRLLAPRLLRAASFLNVNHMLLTVSLGFCFLLSWLAAQMQLAPIVGAFAAGLILDPVHYQDFVDKGEHSLEELVRPIAAFLVPVFFVLTGASVDLRALGEPGVLLFAAALTLAAVVGKQACGLAVLEKGLDRVSVGMGMVPRGEVGLIFAGQGQGLLLAGVPVISGSTLSVVVVMVLITTLVTPPLLKWSLRRSDPGTGPVAQT
jgi:Kef-type K+ transport system membrane component KefB